MRTARHTHPSNLSRWPGDRVADLHYSRGVTVEEMRQASMALMQLIPTEPSEAQKVGTLVGADEVGTGIRMRNDLQRPGVSLRAA